MTCINPFAEHLIDECVAADSGDSKVPIKPWVLEESIF
jgi:hypothetical protein